MTSQDDESQPAPSVDSTQEAAKAIPAAVDRQSKKTDKGRLAGLTRKIWWRAHWLAPNLIPPEYRDEAYEKKRDRESNEASRVPEEEDLRVRAVWGVEVFGPNESDRLYEALKTLRWSAGGIGGDEDGALMWVQRQRAYGWGGTYNVGTVVRPGERGRWWGLINEADFPKEVDHLQVRIHQVSPAVTCLVVCFVLNNDASRRYETELNVTRKTRHQRGRRWQIRHWEPSHQKQEAVHAIRSAFRQMIRDWFSRTAPGYFANADARESFPFAELVCTAGEDIFARSHTTQLGFDWRRILANVSPREVWTSSYTTGLKFIQQDSGWHDNPRNILIASVSLACFSQDRLKAYGGGANGAVHICHESLEGLLAYFGISAYLRELSRELKVTREELNLSNSRQKTLRVIDRIQQFFDRNAGVPAAARELRDITKHRGMLEHDCGSFTAPAWRNERRTRSFAKGLEASLHHAASVLIEDESSTREHLEQLSTVLSIRESIRTQRRMEYLTIAALIVAALSLAAAWPNGWFSVLKANLPPILKF